MPNIVREVEHVFYEIAVIFFITYLVAAIIIILDAISNAWGEPSADIINQSNYVIIVLFVFMLAVVGLGGFYFFIHLIDALVSRLWE
jgi:uncharacterized membrane protein